MKEATEIKNTKRQGKNVRLARDLRGLSQQELAEKLNKQQSEMSRIENLDSIDDELLDQIALALDVSPDFLRNFDLTQHAKTFNNEATINSAENSQDTLNQGNDTVENIYNYPIDQFKDFAENTLKLQKELLEEKFQIEKDYALLKQELEALKNKK